MGDAGVGDQHLDRAVLGLDGREGGLDRLGVGDVAPDVERALGGATAAGGHRDLVAVGDERLGDRAADAAVAAGDQRRTGPWTRPVAHASDAIDYHRSTRKAPWSRYAGRAATRSRRLSAFAGSG